MLRRSTNIIYPIAQKFSLSLEPNNTIKSTRAPCIGEEGKGLHALVIGPTKIFKVYYNLNVPRQLFRSGNALKVMAAKHPVAPFKIALGPSYGHRSFF